MDRNRLFDDPAMVNTGFIRHLENEAKTEQRGSGNVFVNWPEKTKENNVKHDRLGKLLSVGDRCVCYSNVECWIKGAKKVCSLCQYEGEVIKFTKNYVVVRVTACDDEEEVGKVRRCQPKNVFKM